MVEIVEIGNIGGPKGDPGVPGAPGGSLDPTPLKTANFTAFPNDFVPVDTTSGNVTITLPTTPANNTTIGVRHVTQGGTNTVTVAAGGTDKFNKPGVVAPTYSLALVNQGAIFTYDSSVSVWYTTDQSFGLATLDARFAAIGGGGGGAPSGPAGGSLNGTYPDPTLAANSVANTQMADNAVGTVEIVDANVTNAKLANMAQTTVKGRAAGAGTGVPTDLSQTQLTALINPLTSTLSGAAPASGGGTTNYLRADGTWALPDTSTLASLAYVDAHLTDTLDAHDASAISVVPQGQQVGTDVQSAINNLDTRISTMFENGPDYLKSWALFYDDFLSSGIVANQIGSLGWQTTITGTGAIAPPAAPIQDGPGFINLQCGTTATGGASIWLGANDLCGHPLFICEWRVLINALITVGTDEFALRFGLGDVGFGLDPNDGYYFEYTPIDTSWHYKTAKNSVRTDVDSNLLVNTGWHRFRIVSDGGGAITFTIDGANAQTILTNIPTTVEAFGPGAGIVKTLGTTQRQARLDYFYLLWGVNR